jgi:hypothetical protein
MFHIIIFQKCRWKLALPTDRNKKPMFPFFIKFLFSFQYCSYFPTMDPLEAIRARLMATHNRNSIRVFLDSRNSIIVSVPDYHVDPYVTIHSMLLSRYANELTLYIRGRFRSEYWQAQGFEIFQERHHRHIQTLAFFLWSLRYGEQRPDRDLFDPLPELLAWFEHHFNNMD